MFDFKNLDADTRLTMLDAIKEAEASENIYFGTRLIEDKKTQWVSLLKQAAKEHNEQWLGEQLKSGQFFKPAEVSRKRSGGFIAKRVPHTAAQTLADGQFNRFYMLGLCRQAKLKGIESLEIYRAKEGRTSRSNSESLIGTKILVKMVEEQLENVGSSLKSNLTQSNSGLSLMYPF